VAISGPLLVAEGQYAVEPLVARRLGSYLPVTMWSRKACASKCFLRVIACNYCWKCLFDFVHHFASSVVEVNLAPVVWVRRVLSECLGWDVLMWCSVDLAVGDGMHMVV
jgi:hypothetical protein